MKKSYGKRKSEMENSHFIEYAADVMSTLKKDHNFYEIEDMMRNPKSTVRTLLNMLVTMSNDTLTKLNRIKSKEARRYLKECSPQKNGAKPAMPDYMSIGEPEKFNAIDLHLLITKMKKLRPLLDKIV
ncbi:uncharacterized protein [Bemisia tabaci]|uniref:uncharacterized protein isoform X2 n=1 Tax=Bemisia tabaci TaxID=7038 RepID=UPI003B27F2E7